jgi:hypothetical protein
LLSNLTAGGDYTVTPVLDANYLNGVSTFDLVLIQRHILGVQLLDSPYKMIAADANNSQTITTSDIIMLRRLILSILTICKQHQLAFRPGKLQLPGTDQPVVRAVPRSDRS